MREDSPLGQWLAGMRTSASGNGHTMARDGKSEPKVVVVTGASAGVGRATARAFAREGAAVALLARGKTRLHLAADEVRALGGAALPIPTDVADVQQVEDAAARAEQELGPIDIWVNNAMATVFGRFLDSAPAEFVRSNEVTYLGSVWGTMSALRRMVPRNRGVVVQVGSALAYRGLPLQAPYSGAKHALQGFVESVRAELAHDGSAVRLAMVQLPALNTPQFSWARSTLRRHPQPVPPIFQPDLAAQAIVWIAHHPRRELYVGWPTVKAIVGDRLVPLLAERYVARTGVESQQLDEPLEQGREGNLFDPAPDLWAAHGRFDDRARASSAQLWASRHRGLLGVGGAVLAASLASVLSSRVAR